MSRLADPFAKSRLLCAARSEFARCGLTEARVEDIARGANLAKGTFYLHFASKEEAFQEIVDHFFAQLVRYTEGCRPNLRLAQDIVELQACLRRQDVETWEFLWAERDIVAMLYQTASIPQYAHLLEAFLTAQTAIAAEQIRELQGRGLYRNTLDADLVATSIVGAYHNLGRRMVQQKTRPDLEAWVESITQLFLFGLEARI